MTEIQLSNQLETLSIGLEVKMPYYLTQEKCSLVGLKRESIFSLQEKLFQMIV